MTEQNIIDILYVEDNPNDVELTMIALKENNLANNVYTVKDGEEALEFLFSTGRYKNREDNIYLKVILLDLKLPKVDGIDVLKKIRSNEKTKCIPVVILTSSREERDIIETYKLGVNSYIVKPVQFENFIKTIKDLGLYWLVINQPPVAQ
jgi:two-component system, response regulator